MNDMHLDKTKPILIRLDTKHICHDSGNAYIYDLPNNIPAGDVAESVYQSNAILFENGTALGPGHSEHKLIRSTGCGYFSHWDRQLYFSSGDNSSPIKNRRDYHLFLPGNMFKSEDSIVSIDAHLLDKLNPDERFQLARDSFKSITNSMPLPDNIVLMDYDALNKMTSMERFYFARSIYRRLWDDTPLPDHGRRIDHDKDFAREFARLSPESDVTHERKYNLDQLFELVGHIDGDVAECGAYKGGSAYFLARRISEQRLNKRLCLFDSFEGISVPGDMDGNYWHAGALTSSIEDVENALAPLGPLTFVEIYKGWIPERFNEMTNRRFCFVHIDVDLYQPTHDSITFFYPQMTPGGIILLDDYGFDSCPGVTDAVDRFMTDKPEPIINLASGGAFIMKQAADSNA